MADKIIQLKDSQGNNLYPVMTCNIDELASGTGMEKKKLLWTNANPTSEFAAQTVSLDLSGYDAVEIEYYASISKVVLDVVRRKVGASSALMGHINQRSTNSYYNVLSRTINVTTSGITFESGFSKRAGTTNNYSTDNSYIIPYKIYGIKGV